MKLTDTHCHLHFENFREDLPQVIDRAREAGVRRILTLGTELSSSRESLAIAERYAEVFAAAGIHPTDVHRSAPEDGRRIEELAAGHSKIIAIGEIGLDLYWKDVPLSDQLPVFEEMLAMAERLNLPVVIHNRDAQPQMREFFRAHGIRQLRGQMHSFAGTVDDAEFYLERGMYISFTGVITFKNFRQTEVVRHIPLDRILLETDSPFLTPAPYRGKRNEPAYVRFVAGKLAELHGRSAEEIAEITFANARTLFGW